MRGVLRGSWQECTGGSGGRRQRSYMLRLTQRQAPQPSPCGRRCRGLPADRHHWHAAAMPLLQDCRCSGGVRQCAHPPPARPSRSAHCGLPQSVRTARQTSRRRALLAASPHATSSTGEGAQPVRSSLCPQPSGRAASNLQLGSLANSHVRREPTWPRSEDAACAPPCGCQPPGGSKSCATRCAPRLRS